jgi:hypothetical protein
MAREELVKNIEEVNGRIETLEKFLQYAKEPKVIISLCDDILDLRLKREIYNCLL